MAFDPGIIENPEWKDASSLSQKDYPRAKWLVRGIFCKRIGPDQFAPGHEIEFVLYERDEGCRGTQRRATVIKFQEKTVQQEVTFLNTQEPSLG